MEAMTYVLDDRVWTREERDALPPDGSRHELVDGALVVTPAPSPSHQRVAFRLARVLDDAAPPGIDVLLAPVDVVLSDDTVVEPDVLVAPRDSFARTHLEGAPLLAVEVLSPSTQVIDRNLKLRRYESAGTPSYWLVDPGDETRPPSIEAYELRDGRYVLTGEATGDQSWAASLPFPVTVRPADLAR